MTEPKILIIDDDRELQKLLGEAFRQDGFAVLQEYGGARGLNAAVRENPDVVLLDVMTPELRGTDVLRELRRRRVRTRVVVFTGAVRSVEHIVELVRHGACDYLEKTGDIDAVINGVRRALEVGGTLDTLVTETAPLIEELSLKAKTLERENEALRAELRMQQIFALFARITLVLVAVGMAIVLQYFKVVSGPLGFAAMVVLLLVLLLPVERIRRLSIKSIKTEGFVEMDAAGSSRRAAHDGGVPMPAERGEQSKNTYQE